MYIGSTVPDYLSLHSVFTFDNMAASNERRIVIVGKTGTGKSSLANTLFGENLFRTYGTLNSGTSQCQKETKSINGKNITLIDTPGLFDTRYSEEVMKKEILRCITECAPGPHVFLIVLKVDRFTEHEQAVITKIEEYFSEEALKYTAVLFTHGDQLNENQTIEDLVRRNKPVSDLVEKCGGRCHVIDNKYWKGTEDEYRNNQVQVEKLLNTIDKMMTDNSGRCFTNEILQQVEEKIQQEEKEIRLLSAHMTVKEIREKAKASVLEKLWETIKNIATDLLLQIFLSVKSTADQIVQIFKL